jgi:hypothetical protein
MPMSRKIITFNDEGVQSLADHDPKNLFDPEYKGYDIRKTFLPLSLLSPNSGEEQWNIDYVVPEIQSPP